MGRCWTLPWVFGVPQHTEVINAWSVASQECLQERVAGAPRARGRACRRFPEPDANLQDTYISSGKRGTSWKLNIRERDNGIGSGPTSVRSETEEQCERERERKKWNIEKVSVQSFCNGQEKEERKEEEQTRARPHKRKDDGGPCLKPPPPQTKGRGFSSNSKIPPRSSPLEREKP